jgi:hypothetical protein
MIKNYKKIIPTKFYNRKLSKQPIPTIVLVGELKKLLTELPDELPVVDRDNLLMGLTVYNISDDKKAYLSIDVEDSDYFD